MTLPGHPVLRVVRAGLVVVPGIAVGVWLERRFRVSERVSAVAPARHRPTGAHSPFEA